MNEQIRFTRYCEPINRKLLDLLNECPFLDERLTFNVQNDDEAFTLVPQNGIAINKEIRDVLGNVEQDLIYPFTILYRVKPTKREEYNLNIKDYLDRFAHWLDQLKHERDINASFYTDNSNKIFEDLYITTPVYLSQQYQDGVQDWCFNAELKYKSFFTE